MPYYEELELWVEQNGFKTTRSCDSIFSLTLVIRNQISCNKGFVLCLINKTFNWLDRNLLHFNIDGKVHFTINAMYTKSFFCLKVNNFLTEFLK